jgi:hypothetical protein
MPFCQADILFVAQQRTMKIWRAPTFPALFFLDLTILWVPYPLPEKPRGFCGGEGKGGLKTYSVCWLTFNKTPTGQHHKQARPMILRFPPGKEEQLNR